MTSLMPFLRFRVCMFLFQDGDTALIWASLSGHAEVVSILIQASASLNIQNQVLSFFSSPIIYPLICSVVGALVFQTGYHPRKRTFKTHPKQVFFRYENRP